MWGVISLKTDDEEYEISCLMDRGGKLHTPYFYLYKKDEVWDNTTYLKKTFIKFLFNKAEFEKDNPEEYKELNKIIGRDHKKVRELFKWAQEKGIV